MSSFKTTQRYAVLEALNRNGGRASLGQFLSSVRELGETRFNDPDSLFLPQALRDVLSEYRGDGYVRISDDGKWELTADGRAQLALLEDLVNEEMAA